MRQRLMVRNGIVKSESSHAVDIEAEVKVNAAKLVMFGELVEALDSIQECQNEPCHQCRKIIRPVLTRAKELK